MNIPQTVIITGAGSGIGKACAQLYYQHGWNVVLVGRTLEKLEAVKQGWDTNRALALSCDVSSPDDVQACIKQTVDTFGAITVLINNAGVAEMGPITDINLETWNKVQSINVTGMYLMIKNAYEHLLKAKGNIVNVSSVSGIGGDWGAFAYNTSKGAVSNLTKALSLDFGQKGLRINAVAPSLTDTEMAGGVYDNKKLYEKFCERIPMGRGAEPAEVADVVYFLSSDQARFVNGVILPVDGGLSASNGQPPLSMV